MWVSALLSALHLGGLAFGAGGLFIRGRELRRGVPDRASLDRLLAADAAWGIAALLWFTTGPIRLFFVEKSPGYYFGNGFFWVKMALVAIIVALEIWPMITFIRWRVTPGKGGTPDLAPVPAFRRINEAQMALLPLIVLSASSMADGLWLFA